MLARGIANNKSMCCLRLKAKQMTPAAWQVRAFYQSATAVAAALCTTRRWSQFMTTAVPAKENSWSKTYGTMGFPMFRAYAIGLQPSHDLAVRCRTVAAAAAAGAEPNHNVPTVEFDSNWVNTVGLTGVVLKGPTRQTFPFSGKRKAVMLLGLFNRTTGDQIADRPHPILVVAWDEKADALATQVQLGATLLVLGHVSLDYRAQHSSTAHGPALYVTADKWAFVARESVPAGRYARHDTGGFDAVFDAIVGTAKQEQGDSAAAGSRYFTKHRTGQASKAVLAEAETGQSAPGPRKGRASGLDAAPLLLLQGRRLPEIASELGVTQRTVREYLLTAAEAEGLSSQLWSPLLGMVFTPQQEQQHPRALAADFFDAMERGIQAVGSDGKMKPIREYLLSSSSGVAAAVLQEEDAAGGPGVTYDKLSVLLLLRRLGGHPNQYL